MQWFLQHMVEQISDVIKSLRVLLYNRNGVIDDTNPLDVAGEVDISDRDDRELGEVSVTGPVDISDRAGRKLGQVTFPEAQEVTLTGTPEVQLTGTPEVQLTGTSVPLRGLASERPAASAANKGYVYWSLDTGDVSVSTGTTWRSLGVA